MSGNIPLTKILMAGLVTTFLISAILGVYSQFVVLNGVTIDEPYNTALYSISSQYNNFGEIADTSSDQGLVTNILDFGRSAITGTVNVFVVGLEAVGNFFTLIPIIGNVFSAVSTAVPAFAGVLGLLTLLTGLYIAMRYIQTMTSKSELP